MQIKILFLWFDVELIVQLLGCFNWDVFIFFIIEFICESTTEHDVLEGTVAGTVICICVSELVGVFTWLFEVFINVPIFLKIKIIMKIKLA